MIIIALKMQMTVTAISANLALGKPVFASSTDDSSERQASKAFDGNPKTRWASTLTNQQWIYVDLGSAQSITEIVLHWETAYAKQFQIQTSNDGSTWTTGYSNYNGNGGVNTINFAVTARYVKMYAWERATEWGYSLWEFEVLGAGTSPISPPGSGSINVLDYLKSISGSKTAIGIHNREPNSEPALQTNRIYSIQGVPKVRREKKFE